MEPQIVLLLQELSLSLKDYPKEKIVTMNSEISDRRFKYNIIDLPSPLTKVLSTRPRQFERVNEPGVTRYGFIAQEFILSFPDCVYTNGDDGEVPLDGAYPWSLNFAASMPYLFGATIELNTLVGTAQTTANSAQSLASMANTSASSAQTTATAASTAASTAAGQAATAITLANAAQTTANSAMVQTTAPEGDLGTLTWNGTAPGGTTTKRFKWFKQGNVCTIQFQVKCATAGLLVSSFSVPLPAGAPTPYNLSNQSNDSWVAMGSGGVLAGVTVALAGNNAGLYKNSGGTYELRAFASVTLSAGVAMGTISYLCT